MEVPYESTTLSDPLSTEEEEVDYGSAVESKARTPVRDDRPRHAPNLFPELGAADALTALHVIPGMG